MLGAGDAFMAGFLRGWLRGEPVETLLRIWQCLRRDRRLAPWLRAGHADRKSSCKAFLARPIGPYRLRDDAALDHLHWATTRDRDHRTS